MKRNYFTILLLLPIFILGCSSVQTEPAPQSRWHINSSKYVFIEHHTSVHGDLIEGEYPFLYIDFPTYSFNEEAGTLTTKLDIEINESLKAIYGDGKDLSGCAGSGIATGIYGVYELPYEFNEIKIEEIEADGTVHLAYNALSIVLKSGEKWSNIKSTVDTKETNGIAAKAKLTTTDTIVNYGILDKANIASGY